MSRLLGAALVVLLGLRAAFAGECVEVSSSPAVVAYGGGPGGDLVEFSGARGGVVHARDLTSGRTLWRFTLPDLEGADPARVVVGDIRALRFDANRDGRVDPDAGDRVWIFFGTRGARVYYALDVTERELPRVKWRLGPEQLPGTGETWSAPTLVRVRIAGARQNGERIVAIVGGGYAADGDESGRRLFMIDAHTGRVLWAGGGPVGGTETLDTVFEEMLDPVPARIAALDTDGDLFADRMYVGDAGGRLWRFDIWNGKAARDLVTGGVLASLGAADANGIREDARRFYAAPDVALVQKGSAAAYYNIALGSGDASRPGDTQTHEHFYSIRDRNPFAAMAQAEYSQLVPIREADLVDVTSAFPNPVIPPDAPGWKIDLQLHGGAGEKVLAAALTAGGTILLTTFQPGAGSEENCAAPGINRVYALRLDSGDPSRDQNADGRIDPPDASVELTQPGIAGEPTLEVRTRSAGPPGDQGEPTDALASVECRVGDERSPMCAPLQALRRTFWYRRNVD